MKGSFCIPFVFWNHSAQSFPHLPTAVAIQGELVATGSDTGEICLWEIEDSGVQPKVIATPGFQMQCKVLAFLSGPCSLALGLETLILSIHADNRMRTWDTTDCKCVSSSSDSLLPKHTRFDQIAILESRLAALGGELKEIVIVDCWIMSKIAVLQLGGGLAGVDYYRQGRMLAALTSEGQLKFWSLPDYSRFLVKDANPPQINPNCVLQVTMQTQEKPQGLSMSPDGSLVALAYETTISFIHRSWVTFTQFGQMNRNEAYLRLDVSIKVVKMTDDDFFILTTDGRLAVYSLDSICEEIKVDRKPANQPHMRAPRHREMQTFTLTPPASLYIISPDLTIAAISADWLVVPGNSSLTVHRLPDLVDSMQGTLVFRGPGQFSDEKVQGYLRPRETISTGSIVTTGSWPYYLLGTSLGKIFVMPLSQLLVAKWLEYHVSAISALYYAQGQLISCSEDGLICLWDFDPEKVVSHDDSTVKSPSDQRLKARSMTVVPGRSSYSPLSDKPQRAPRLETRFTGTPIRTLIPVKALSGTIEGVSQQLWEARWSEWENTLLAQQEDGSVLLFSLSNLNIFCTFQGVKAGIRSGIIHVLLEYLLVVDEHDVVYVFNMMSQALERQVTGAAALTILRKEGDSGLVFEKMTATVSTAQNLVEFNAQFLAADKPISAINERYIYLGGCKLPMLLIDVTQLQSDIAAAGQVSGENSFILSLLTDWREETVFHSQIRKFFKAQQPAVNCCAGTLGVSGCMSFNLPVKNHWDTSAHIRTSLSTAILRILSSTVKFIPNMPVVKTATKVFIHANLSPLSLAHESLQGILPARKLLLRTLRVRSPKERQALAKAWGRVLKRASAQVTNVRQSLTQSSFSFSLTKVEEQYMYVSLAQALGAVVLSCLLKEGVHITPAWSRALLKALSAMIRAEKPTYVALACLCFSATFKDWDSLFPAEEHPTIKRELISAVNRPNELIQTCAFKAFEKMSQSNTVKLVEFLVVEMMTSGVETGHAKAMLRIAEYLVKRQSAGLVTILPLLVELILRSLDPHEASLRKACIEITQEVLQQMVVKLPMASFSQQKQRLAIGTFDCKVIVYDLKTATRWKVLEDHKHSVTAVAFSNAGTHLASYSGPEMAIKLWKLDGGFFEGIMGGNNTKPLHSYPLMPLKGPPPDDYLKRVKLSWANSDQLIQLTREDGSEVNYPFPR